MNICVCFVWWNKWKFFNLSYEILLLYLRLLTLKSLKNNHSVYTKIEDTLTKRIISTWVIKYSSRTSRRCVLWRTAVFKLWTVYHLSNLVDWGYCNEWIMLKCWWHTYITLLKSRIRWITKIVVVKVIDTILCAFFHFVDTKNYSCSMNIILNNNSFLYLFYLSWI